MPIFAGHDFLVSLIFLKRPLVFLILLFSSISLHCSLKKAFLSLLPILWNSAFSWVHLSLSLLPFASLSFFYLFVSPPQTTTLPSCISFSWDNFGHHLVDNAMNFHPQFFRYLSTRTNPLNLTEVEEVKKQWQKYTFLTTKLVDVMEIQLTYFKFQKMMLLKCCTQYASKFGKLSSGHRIGKGQFSV